MELDKNMVIYNIVEEYKEKIPDIVYKTVLENIHQDKSKGWYTITYYYSLQLYTTKCGDLLDPYDLSKRFKLNIYANHEYMEKMQKQLKRGFQMDVLQLEEEFPNIHNYIEMNKFSTTKMINNKFIHILIKPKCYITFIEKYNDKCHDDYDSNSDTNGDEDEGYEEDVSE